MTAQLIDGNALAKKIRAEVAQRAAALTAAGRRPGLAVILVGHNPASEAYVRNKVKDCEESGLRSVLERHPETIGEAELLARVRAFNDDPSIDGLLVQLPLPPHIDAQKVIETIAPDKDVDGFSVHSAGSLLIGRPGFKACTPYGCMKLLESIGCDPKGKHAVVIGRSNIVGKPMAVLLLQANATVTICHSGTPDLAHHTRQADIVVAAVGKRGVLTAGMVKPGAVVIDVGMNRVPDGEPGAGKLVGDVDFDDVSRVAGWVTPVPGGVGPMTRAMLLVNTMESAERKGSMR